MAFLYGRAGRLTAKNGGFRPGQCGICYGDGFSCLDCAGIPNGGAVVDACGVCGGGIDDAGVCDGGGAVSGDGATQCSFLELMACLDEGTLSFYPPNSRLYGEFS